MMVIPLRLLTVKKSEEAELMTFAFALARSSHNPSVWGHGVHEEGCSPWANPHPSPVPL